MYAPVRGPKTAVPLNEALLKRVEEGVTFYKVNGKKGTIVRKEADMSSDKVQIIESGTVEKFIPSIFRKLNLSNLRTSVVQYFLLLSGNFSFQFRLLLR